MTFSKAFCKDEYRPLHSPIFFKMLLMLKYGNLTAEQYIVMQADAYIKGSKIISQKVAKAMGCIYDRTTLPPLKNGIFRVWKTLNIPFFTQKKNLYNFPPEPSKQLICQQKSFHLWAIPTMQRCEEFIPRWIATLCKLCEPLLDGNFTSRWRSTRAGAFCVMRYWAMYTGWDHHTETGNAVVSICSPNSRYTTV